MNIPVIILIVIIVIALFFALREVTCWYFKINNIVADQAKTNLLLTKILQQLGGSLENKSETKVEVDPTITYDYLDDNGKVRNVTAKTAEKAGWTLVIK